MFKSRPEKDELFCITCVSCKNCICKTCTNLVTSRNQVLAPNSRILVIHCAECKSCKNTQQAAEKQNKSSENNQNKCKRTKTNDWKKWTRTQTNKNHNTYPEASQKCSRSQRFYLYKNLADITKKNNTTEKEIDEIKNKNSDHAEQCVQILKRYKKTNGILSSKLKQSKRKCLNLRRSIRVITEKDNNKTSFHEQYQQFSKTIIRNSKEDATKWEKTPSMSCSNSILFVLKE